MKHTMTSDQMVELRVGMLCEAMGMLPSRGTEVNDLESVLPKLERVADSLVRYVLTGTMVPSLAHEPVAIDMARAMRVAGAAAGADVDYSKMQPQNGG